MEKNQSIGTTGMLHFIQRPPRYRLLLLLILIPLLGGCISLATERLAGNLGHAMLNQSDPDTVRAGAPAYLLLIDGLIADFPRSRSLLIAGAQLYNAYAGGLVRDPERTKRLSQKALTYARRAICAPHPDVCAGEKKPFMEFARVIDGIGVSDLDILYTYASSWAGWIATRTDDWGALADLPKVEHTLRRITMMDPGYDRGRAQLYLGVMRTQLPPALGGKPENGRAHFEKAISYSNGRDLMAKVEFARRYARLVFNQELHDQLLKEVLEADPEELDLTLSNVLAQQQAKKLLQDEYF
jgi:hypothetical protein